MSTELNSGPVITAHNLRKMYGPHLALDDVDLEIPGRPFTFGELIHAQAAGDATVLAEGHGRPVVTLTLTDPQVDVMSLFEAAQ